MKDIQIPFVKGQETSAAPKAFSEAGKFRRAHNLCIEPTATDALSVRRSAFCVGVADHSSFTNKRYAAFGDKIALCQPTSIDLLNDSESGWVGTSTTRNLDLLSAAPLEWQPDTTRTVEGCAFIRSSNGSEMTVFYDKRVEASAIVAQANIEGVKRASVEIQTVLAGAITDTHGQALFLFDGSSANNYVLVHGDPTASTVRIRTYSPGSNAWTLAFSITTAVLLDANQTAAGISVLYRNTSSGDLRLTMRSNTGASLWDIIVNSTQDNPKVGTCSASGTNLHIYSGEYDADLNRIRTFHVNTSTQAVTVGAVVTTFGEQVQSLSCCPHGANSLASWCYAVGHTNGRAALFSGISNLSSVNRIGWCPRIDASGRIFTPTLRAQDSNPEPYVIGSLGTQVGIWNLDCSGTLKPACVVMYAGSRAYYRNPGPLSAYISRSGSVYVSGDAGKGIVLTKTGPEVIEWGLHPTRAGIASHGGFPIMSLGAPKYFDSSRWCPVGFSQPPVATVALVPAGVGLSEGVYVYGLVWEWVDTRGRRHQSPPSLYTVTAAAGDRANITVYAWSVPADERLNDPSNPTTLSVYRSLVGETTLHRIRTFPVADPYATASFMVTEIGLIDSFVGSQEILYTTSAGLNELGAYAMDAADHVIGYADRFVYHTPAFPNKLFYSKSFRDGRCVEFNPALSFVMPEDVTGLAAQDGNIYAFSATQVYAISPTFAADDGSGAVPIDPVPLSPGIGTQHPASIVHTPEGIFFRGARGFFILPRGGGPPLYAGMPLEGNLQSAVYGSAHNAATSEVAWVTSFSSQQVVVYNYLFRQWFTWEMFVGANLLLQGGACCTPRNGFFYFGQASGVVTLIRLDSSGQGTDFGNSILSDAPIGIVLETADIGVADLGKRNRILRAAIEMDGTAGSAAMTVEESHDQGASYSNAVSFDVTTGEPLVYQVAKRKTAGMRLRIRSTTTALATKLYGMTLRLKPLTKTSTSGSNRKG